MFIAYGSDAASIAGVPFKPLFGDMNPKVCANVRIY
jgi:hypothetical protein